ncbi:MAG TPA: DUF3450 family protein [Lacunisphaera sp.]|nr:DUF3450 family protein [Lacunisphaera sp.]
MPIQVAVPRLARHGRYGLVFGFMVGVAAGAASDPIREVGKTASEWVNTRAETVRIEKAWTQDRTLLQSTINGLKERASRLQDRRDHLFAATAEERAELAALNAKLGESRETLRLTEARLQVLTEKIARLRPFLPPRLSEALEMSYRSLESQTPSPGERMQLVVTVLNRCAQFNLTITHGEEVLTLPGEAGPKAVDVIYWGLSHGYALDRAAGRAWLGTPGAERWEWESLPDAAPAIAELMAIRLDEADPRLVSIPARLKANP